MAFHYGAAERGVLIKKRKKRKRKFISKASGVPTHVGRPIERNRRIVLRAMHGSESQRQTAAICECQCGQSPLSVLPLFGLQPVAPAAKPDSP